MIILIMIHKKILILIPIIIPIIIGGIFYKPKKINIPKSKPIPIPLPKKFNWEFPDDELNKKKNNLNYINQKINYNYESEYENELIFQLEL